MQDTDEARGRLIRAFAGNDMEKLFYFCLKKTGSYPEAEDLTQDIAMQIIAALSKAWYRQTFRHGYGRLRGTGIRHGQKKNTAAARRQPMPTSATMKSRATARACRMQSFMRNSWLCSGGNLRSSSATIAASSLPIISNAKMFVKLQHRCPFPQTR